VPIIPAAGPLYIFWAGSWMCAGAGGRAPRIQLSLRPAYLSTGEEGRRGPRGWTAGAGGERKARSHVPAGPVSSGDGRQNSNSRGGGTGRAHQAGRMSAGDPDQKTSGPMAPIREEWWWCQAGGPTLRRGGGPPATTRDATRGVRLSEIQRMQRDRQEEASAEECTLCTESDRSRLGQEPSSSIAEGWNNTVTWTVKMRIRNHWNNGRKSNHTATTALVCFKI